MIPAVNLRGTNAPTFTEKYPPGAYQWDTDYGAGDVVSGTAVIGTLAQIALTMLVWWGVIVTRVVPWAWSLPQISPKLIDGLLGGGGSHNRTVFIAIATALVSATGAWVLWMTVVKHRVLEALSHIGWMLMLMTSTLVLLYAPGRIVSSVNRATVAVQRSVLSTMSAADPRFEPADGTAKTATFDGSSSDASIRHAVDVWWRLFIFKGWVWGETGRGDSALGEQILASRSAGTDNLTAEEQAFLDHPDKTSQLMLAHEHCWGKEGLDAISCIRGSDFAKFRDRTLEKIPGVKPWINGKKPSERLLMAVIVGLSSLMSGLFLLGLSLMIIMWTYAGTFYFVAWVYYAVGGLVGVKGRRQFTQYTQTLSETFLRRIAAAWVLTFVMLIFTSAASAAAQTEAGWIVAMLSQLGACGVLLLMMIKHKRQTGHVLPKAVRDVVKLSAANGIAGRMAAVKAKRAGRTPSSPSPDKPDGSPGQRQTRPDLTVTPAALGEQRALNPGPRVHTAYRPTQPLVSGATVGLPRGDQRALSAGPRVHPVGQGPRPHGPAPIPRPHGGPYQRWLARGSVVRSEPARDLKAAMRGQAIDTRVVEEP